MLALVIAAAFSLCVRRIFSALSSAVFNLLVDQRFFLFNFNIASLSSSYNDLIFSSNT